MRNGIVKGTLKTHRLQAAPTQQDTWPVAESPSEGVPEQDPRGCPSIEGVVGETSCLWGGSHCLADQTGMPAAPTQLLLRCFGPLERNHHDEQRNQALKNC